MQPDHPPRERAITITQNYDAQGRMTGVSAVRDPLTTTITDTSRLTHTLYLPLVSNGATAIVTAATYLYDADGMRVKGVVGGITTVYIAGVYEWQAGATTKYYDGGAMRRSGYASDNGISYILCDPLGSSSVIVGQTSGVQATDYYYPFGANRGGSAFSELTAKQFTGQYGASGLAGSEGLNYYGARWYDAQLGRFVSADTIVPNPATPQALNRYAYVSNNPVNLTDSKGHACDDGPQTWAACQGNRVSGSIMRAADSCSFGRCYRLSHARLARGMGKDLTQWTVRVLNENAGSQAVQTILNLNETAAFIAAAGDVGIGMAAILKAQAYSLWNTLVKNQAVWDFKHAMLSIVGENYVLGDDWFEYSTIGNIHYGYVGSAAGFSAFELHGGAGYAEIGDNINTMMRTGVFPNPNPIRIWALGDQVDDYYAVEFGIQLHKKNGGSFSKTDFVALLPTYSALMSRTTDRMSLSPSAEKTKPGAYPSNYFDGPFSPPANDS